uniref:Small ribosomal subunit protein uS4 n=1 Tax=Desulfobacca acetoxidans TaxID=60893 RepID=A0A7C3WS28_9BACT
MARYTGPACRLCRRERMALFLKGDRCYTDKCAIRRRNFPPGQHGQGRGKISDYGLQLREKQKVKRIYGLLENQFKGYFEEAERQRGVTGTNLLVLLERRLDNVVYRLGFANSRAQARQLVRHNHILVNGQKVNIPSYSVKVGDVIEVAEKSRNLPQIRDALEAVARRGCPAWLELNKEAMRGRVVMMPTREDITMPIEEHLIVELYSK